MELLERRLRDGGSEWERSLMLAEGTEAPGQPHSHCEAMNVHDGRLQRREGVSSRGVCVCV